MGEKEGKEGQCYKMEKHCHKLSHTIWAKSRRIQTAHTERVPKGISQTTKVSFGDLSSARGGQKALHLEEDPFLIAPYPKGFKGNLEIVGIRRGLFKFAFDLYTSSSDDSGHVAGDLREEKRFLLS